MPPLKEWLGIMWPFPVGVLFAAVGWLLTRPLKGKSSPREIYGGSMRGWSALHWCQYGGLGTTAPSLKRRVWQAHKKLKRY